MLNEKTLFLIYRLVKLSVLEKIFHTKTAKETWKNTLLKTYESANPVKRIRLLGLNRQFKLMEQEKDDESVRDYFPRMEKLVNEMKINAKHIV